MLAPLTAGQPVAIRAPGGRFLTAAADGSLRPEALSPAAAETFDLSGSQDQFTLKTADGRFLVADGHDARTLRADSPRSEPGDRETFVLVPVGETAAGLKARGYRDLLRFAPPTPQSPDAKPTEGPRPEETVELYSAVEVPAAVRSALGTAIGTFATELAGKEYDKVRTRKRQRSIALPAPTLHDLRRKKEHRVLTIEETYRVQAQLDGTPDIQIERMSRLRNYRLPDRGLLVFVVSARVPVRGLAQYQQPGLLSASTKFRTLVDVRLAAQVPLGKADDKTPLLPEVLDFDARLRNLDLSKDLLQAAHRPIEEFLNEELQQQHEKIRGQATKSLRKALDSKAFQNPLLKFLLM